MPIIPVPQRGRVIPNEKGIAALKEWVEAAPDLGQKGARALHVKSLHTPRGIGAKTMSFFWLDIPFRAAGAAVRGGYQPGLTCPLCVSLDQAGLTPRGQVKAQQPVSSPSVPQPLPPPEICWLEAGERYRVGYTLTSPYYGIWDVQNPGSAIQQFPYSDHGKSEVIARFNELEHGAPEEGHDEEAVVSNEP